jgi:hypothetical protein
VTSEHRAVEKVSNALQKWRSGTNGSQHSPEGGVWKPAEAGTELMRFQLTALSIPPGQVKVKIGTAMTVQIEKSGLSCDGMIIQMVLQNCINYVADINNAFGGFSFPNSVRRTLPRGHVRP